MSHINKGRAQKALSFLLRGAIIYLVFAGFDMASQRYSIVAGGFGLTGIY